MLTTAGGPIPRWSQSTDREIGNMSGVGDRGLCDAGLPCMLLPIKHTTYINVVQKYSINGIICN